MNNKYNKAFGRALRILRKRQQFSQEYLGFESGLTRAYISLLERGLRSPTLDTIMALCGALGITLVIMASMIESELHHGHNN